MTAESSPTTESVLAPGDVVWTLVGQHAVVHHPQRHTAYLLDPMAAVLWQCLDGVSPLGEVLADIADVLEVPLDRVTGDCLPVLGSWIAAGIAVDAGAPPAAPSIRTWRRLVDPPNA